MDTVTHVFDTWANNGRAEKMEVEHQKSVSTFLGKIHLKNKFSFLDVGCGNGWTVRLMAQKNCCQKAIGIDKSRKMIRSAKRKMVTKKEEYICADIVSLKTRKRFDYIFSMESLYYSDSVEVSLAKIFTLLKSGGEFFCGTDFYADNRATSHWPKMMNLKLHLYSKKEWGYLLKNAGFKVKIRQIKDANSARKWRREFGTLFLTGTKPER